MADYSAVVMDHFHNPRNVGELTDADGFAHEGKPGAGPVMEIWIRLNGTCIAAATFKANGCGAAIATCSLLTEMAIGLPLEQAAKISPEVVVERLGGLPLGKRHCPAMAVTAFQKAVENARKKIGV